MGFEIVQQETILSRHSSRLEIMFSGPKILIHSPYAFEIFSLETLCVGSAVSDNRAVDRILHSVLESRGSIA